MSATVSGTEQRLAALARGNEVKRERERLLGGQGKRTKGKVPPEWVAELLLDPPDALLGMRIDALLARAERYRDSRVREILRAEGVTGTRLVRDLTVRQRAAIAGRLGR